MRAPLGSTHRCPSMYGTACQRHQPASPGHRLRARQRLPSRGRGRALPRHPQPLRSVRGALAPAQSAVLRRQLRLAPLAPRGGPPAGTGPTVALRPPLPHRPRLALPSRVDAATGPRQGGKLPVEACVGARVAVQALSYRALARKEMVGIWGSRQGRLNCGSRKRLPKSSSIAEAQ